MNQKKLDIIKEAEKDREKTCVACGENYKGNDHRCDNYKLKRRQAYEKRKQKKIDRINYYEQDRTYSDRLEEAEMLSCMTFGKEHDERY